MIFRKKQPNIVYASSLEQACSYRDEGFEPIECSFGTQSVTGRYRLDHHGPNQHHTAVSLAACHIALSSGFEPLRRFVATGRPDADSIYAILVLSGEITPFLPLAQAIADLDTDPVGIDQREDPYLQAGPAFRMFNHFSAGLCSYRRALAIGRKVFLPDGLSLRLEARARAYEENRRKTAQKEFFPRKNRVALVQSDTDSTDRWLERFDKSGQPLDFVIQYKPGSKVLTIAGKTPQAVARLGGRGKPATAYFGERGLLDYCATLDQLLGWNPHFYEGSGGRPNIIGSPRKYEVNLDRIRTKVYPALQNLVCEHNYPLPPTRAA